MYQNSSNQDKVYVGMTANLSNRLKEHAKQKKFDKVFVLVNNSNAQHENMMTEAIALIVGYEHVEGGCYASSSDKKALKKVCFSVCNACYSCGSIGKYAGKQSHNCEIVDPNRISWSDTLDRKFAEEFLQYILCAYACWLTSATQRTITSRSATNRDVYL